MTNSVKPIVWGETDTIVAGVRVDQQVQYKVKNVVYFALDVEFDNAVYWPIVGTALQWSDRPPFGSGA